MKESLPQHCAVQSPPTLSPVAKKIIIIASITTASIMASTAIAQERQPNNIVQPTSPHLEPCEAEVKAQSTQMEIVRGHLSKLAILSLEDLNTIRLQKKEIERLKIQRAKMQSDLRKDHLPERLIAGTVLLILGVCTFLLYMKNRTLKATAAIDAEEIEKAHSYIAQMEARSDLVRELQQLQTGISTLILDNVNQSAPILTEPEADEEPTEPIPDSSPDATSNRFSMLELD